MAMIYELHSHTKYSNKCSNLEPVTLLKTAKKKQLNGIAITDHDTIRGALQTIELNKDKDFKVIIGEEITTNSGHLLAYNIQEEIKSKNIIEAIEEIKQQGGLAIHAHPFRIISFYKFLKHFKNMKLDGLETVNGRSIYIDNKLAEITAKKHSLPGIGGSDSHFAFDIGSITTEFNESLDQAIRSNKLRIKGSIINGYLGFIKSRLR